MSHEMAYMGPRGELTMALLFVRLSLTPSKQTAFNHEQSSDAEAEYDRLRGLARQEASKRNSCFQRVR
jgi:hypothetical protein